MRKRWARPRPSSWADCSRVRPALVPWACSCTALPSTKRSPTEREHEQHQQQGRFQHQYPASTEVSVEITGGKPTTTSLDVAKHFGKQHKDVLRAIRNLDCSTEFHERNFAPTIQTVLGPKGAKREEPAFRMTRDGFTFLCMGFTGKEAARWKEAYINAFNKMEQALIEQPEILSHNHLLQFAIKTLDLMRDHTSASRPAPGQNRSYATTWPSSPWTRRIPSRSSRP
ncbi:Rha family transcriptional regulator [Pseudomonas aeruginosa]|nr:Rha family transcriptional regulator [Pseudomonas aeruginosa]